MAGELLRELEEDIQQEQWWSFWRSYGPAIAGLVAATLLATAGYLWWQWRCHNQLEKESAQYEKALSLLSLKGPNAQSHDILSQLSQTGTPGYGTLAQLQLFRLSLLGAETSPMAWEEAQKRGEELLKKAQKNRDGGVEGVVVLALASLYMNAQKPLPEELTQRLSQYNVPQNPWKGLAGEVEALCALQTGRSGDEAGRKYKSLLTASELPQSVQMRASMEMIGKGLAFPEREGA